MAFRNRFLLGLIGWVAILLVTGAALVASLQMPGLRAARVVAVLLFAGALGAARHRAKILLAALASVAVGLLLPRDLFLLGAMGCYALLCVVMVKTGKAGA